MKTKLSELMWQGLQIFYVGANEQTPETIFWNECEQKPLGEGWFYGYSQPGCLFDTDVVGPYGTEQDAIDAAIDNFFDE